MAKAVSFLLLLLSLFLQVRGENLAIIDFTDSEGHFSPDGKKLSLLITAGISAQNISNINLIERAEIEKIMEEEELSLSGLVSNETLLKISSRIGADYLLTGKMYLLDESYYFNGKLTAAVSGQIKGLSLSYPIAKGKDTVIVDCANKIADYAVKQLRAEKKEKAPVKSM